jgi:pyruvate formate lyase activating enzyme
MSFVPRPSRALPLVGSPFQFPTAPGAQPAEDAPGDAPSTPLLGYVHSIFPGSTVDGPGVRLVIFLSGCFFRCLYCHNPDTWKLGSGQRLSVDELLATVDSYATFLRAAGGGVTLSGGEPLVQHEFVLTLAKEIKSLGLSVALDTNGFLGERLTDEDLRLFDLILLDIKESDPARHLALTAQPLQPVLDFARRLRDLDRPAWLRFVLVPGLTDSLENLQSLRALIDELPNLMKIDILPFHQMGRFKWKELALPYSLANTPPASQADVHRARAILIPERI